MSYIRSLKNKKKHFYWKAYSIEDLQRLIQRIKSNHYKDKKELKNYRKTPDLIQKKIYWPLTYEFAGEVVDSNRFIFFW